MGLRRFHIFLLVAYCIAATLMTVWTVNAYAQPPPSIDRLKVYFKGKGYETEPLFSDSRFMVHSDIDSFFIRSAEKKRVDERQAAEKRGDSKKAELIFREEYENYKTLLKFDAKRDSLPGFMGANAEQLARCEERYGIPREALAAVIGIESGFGQYRGAFYAFNVYVSMYMKNYRRSFAVSQLSELLAFCRRTGKDMFELNSSYAGAIGYMQFIPYSLNHWFVGDDVYNMDDAIASTANYL